MKIERIELFRLKVPLKRPYKIATAEMKEFDSTIVLIRSAGREALGEAMSGVEGYFWETPDEVWQFARENGKKLLGRTISRASEFLAGLVARHPCAATPFLTALEVLEESPLLKPSAETRLVPMVGILQASERKDIFAEIAEFLTQDYGTIKIKVGFDPEKDLDKVETAQEALQGKALIRVDANQGYTFPQAEKFVRNINPRGIEFLEQPFKEDAWEDMVKLAKISPIPLGLDESIYGIEAVEKTKKLGCARFVKFKVMKMGSAGGLARGIETARRFGLEVILGNGAAGEISCYHEAVIAANLITRAGEMNGFLKQRESILVEPIQVKGGKIVLNPGFSPKLDPGKIDRFAVDRAVFAPGN